MNRLHLVWAGCRLLLRPQTPSIVNTSWRTTASCRAWWSWPITVTVLPARGWWSAAGRSESLTCDLTPAASIPAQDRGWKSKRALWQRSETWKSRRGAAGKDARLWKSCENHLPADTQLFLDSFLLHSYDTRRRLVIFWSVFISK